MSWRPPTLLGSLALSALTTNSPTVSARFLALASAWADRLALVASSSARRF